MWKCTSEAKPFHCPKTQQAATHHLRSTCLSAQRKTLKDKSLRSQQQNVHMRHRKDKKEPQSDSDTIKLCIRKEKQIANQMFCCPGGTSVLMSAALCATVSGEIGISGSFNKEFLCMIVDH